MGTLVLSWGVPVSSSGKVSPEERANRVEFRQASVVLSYTDLKSRLEGTGNTNRVLFEVIHKSKM